MTAAAGTASGSFDPLSTDPSTLTGQDVEAGLVAAFRADNRAAWARCRWLLEACRSRAGTTARVLGESRAGLIPAAALAWSPAMAAARLEFARQVIERLPALGQGMREGWLEESKAEAIVATVRELDDAQARRVVERLLGRAATLTHPELRRAAENEAAAVDPGWYEARRAAAVARARVVARSAASGAAELSGLDLPEDLALEAHAHVVALADAVRAAVRARGGDVGQGFTEAHVYLALLRPHLLAADDATVIATLTEELLNPPTPTDDDPTDDDPTDDDPTDDDGPSDAPGDDGPDDGGGPRGGGAEDQGPDDAGPDDAGPDDAGPDNAGPDDGRPEPEAAPLAFRAGVAVRLDLTTLLGLDRRPGEVPDYGVVASSTARHLARTRPGAAIRVLLHDPDGHLEHALTLHPRGGRAARRRSRYRRQVIEVRARTTTLDALDPHEFLGQQATLLTRAQKALATQRARPPGDHPALSGADAHRRHPGAALEAWIRARDQTCRFPGCGRPAMRADLDHTRDWLFGGLTEADNLGALCESHHLLKHDPDSGWTVVQSSPGHFVWTSPTGIRHHVDPQRYQEPLGPRPPEDGPTSIPDLVFAPPPRSSPPWAPRRNKHGHLTDAARATATRLTRATAPEAPSSPYDHDPDF
jgi:hypothetical protein